MKATFTFFAAHKKRKRISVEVKDRWMLEESIVERIRSEHPEWKIMKPRLEIRT